MVGGILAWALAVGLPVAGCSSAGSTPPPAPCDQVCQDQIAVRALRETMKWAFNKALFGNDAGPQDATQACALNQGSFHVFGEATSNAAQGATVVKLTYVMDQCLYLQQDTDPTQTYSMVLTGTVTEEGTIAVQPSATTALTIKSDAMNFTGTVHDPPLGYTGTACVVGLVQDGGQLSGTLCGRTAGLTL